MKDAELVRVSLTDCGKGWQGAARNATGCDQKEGERGRHLLTMPSFGHDIKWLDGGEKSGLHGSLRWAWSSSFCSN